MPSAKLRLGVLASGSGSNLQAIIDHCQSGVLDAQVAVVISNVSDAFALERARRAALPAVFLNRKLFPSPSDFDLALLAQLQHHQVSLVILAGYLRKLTAPILEAFPNRILNIHPALLPSFGGKGLYGLKVHEAVLAHGCKLSGLTVHLVDPEYDHGPILLQHPVPVEEDDTPESLQARILQWEHRKYSQAIQLFAQGRVKIEGRKVRILPAA
jgi:phosphoribosylglycinamide formyltransferase-1